MGPREENMKDFFAKINKLSFRKKIVIIFMFFLVLELAPLYIIGFFDIPSADDFGGAISMRNMMNSGSNIFQWIELAWKYMKNEYMTLQGTYSALLIGKFIPIILSDKTYFMGPMILLTFYSAMMFLMLYQVLYKLLKMYISNMMIAYVIITTVSIQLMPSANEGFYWWSGAFLYTFFFSVAMLTISYFFFIFQKKNIGKRDIVHIINLVLLIIIVGGSNYPTAIFMVMIFGSLMLFTILYKRERLSLSVMSFLISVASILVNILAPGNSARMAREGVTYVPTIGRTLLICFRLGFQYFRTWFTVPIILALLLLVPVLFNAFNKSKIRFRYPLLFSIISLSIFCGLFSPAAYSYGWIGPARYMNVIYWGYVLILFMNEVYYIGWIRNIINSLTSDCEAKRLLFEKNLLLELKKYLVFVFLASICVLYIVSRPNHYTGYSTIPETYTSVIAWNSLASGEAKDYYNQWCDRKNILINSEIKEVSFAPYRSKPKLLYFDDITTDSTDWRNSQMKAFYNKDVIVLIE